MLNFINDEKYPLNKSNKVLKQLIQNIQNDLNKDGCSVLKNFIKPSAIQTLKKEATLLAPKAYYNTQIVNVYNTDTNAIFDDTHPNHIAFKRENAFVARDLISDDYLISKLYVNEDFKNFIAQCFGIDKIYELSDPLAGLCLNVLQPNKEHPWHFDTNEFTVSLLVKKASDGGEFQYCPNIRSQNNENFKDVLDIITNKTDDKIKHLNLEIGDLQIFKGRYSLHKVSRVKGEGDRYSAIFAYSKIKGVVGRLERTRQLFGRTLNNHNDTKKQNISVDELMD